MKTEKKILWVDDVPAEEVGGRSLEVILNEVYGDTYKLVKALDGSEAEKKINEDAKKREIRLVLMDLEFKNTKTGEVAVAGPEIAQRLYQLNNTLKFIVLSHKDMKGQVVNFGNAGAKIAYILKDELDKTGTYLFNISRAIIEDYANTSWKFYWDRGTLTIENPGLGFGKKSLSLGGNCMNLLDIGFANPNESISNGVFEKGFSGDDPGTNLPKVFKRINDTLREATNGQIWGILAREKRSEIITVIPKENITIIPPDAGELSPSQAVPVPGSAGLPALEAEVKNLRLRVEKLERLFLKKSKKNK